MFHVEHRRKTASLKGLRTAQKKHKKTAAEKPLTASKNFKIQTAHVPRSTWNIGVKQLH